MVSLLIIFNFYFCIELTYASNVSFGGLHSIVHEYMYLFLFNNQFHTFEIFLSYIVKNTIPVSTDNIFDLNVKLIN